MSRQKEHAQKAHSYEDKCMVALMVGQSAGERAATAISPESQRFLSSHATAQAQIYATLAAAHATLATIPDPIGSHVPKDWS